LGSLAGEEREVAEVGEEGESGDGGRGKERAAITREERGERVVEGATGEERLLE